MFVLDRGEALDNYEDGNGSFLLVRDDDDNDHVWLSTYEKISRGVPFVHTCSCHHHEHA